VTDDQKTNTVDSRKEVLDFLKDLQTHYGTYHNHKETLAWAAVALISGFMISVASQFRDKAKLCCQEQLIMSIIIIVVFAFCFGYVYIQFALRKRAADIIAACLRLRSLIISDTSKVINPTDWIVKTKTQSWMQSDHALPNEVLKMADELSTVGQQYRKSLEFCAYGILFITCIVLIARILTAG
jgi:hypothetical protein